MTLDPPITTIFFDLHGVLIDSSRLLPCTAQQLGAVMAERYGSTPSQWTAAYNRVRADWDSYHADLDFDGDEGLSQVYEGLYRVTRALFRLTQTPEPPHESLRTLSRDLPALMSRACDVIRSEARPVIVALNAHGFRMGVTSYLLESQTQALLEGGGIKPYFSVGVFGVDTLEQFRRDTLYYQRIGVRSGIPAVQCLVVDRVSAHLEAARSAGMQAASVDVLRTLLDVSG